MGGKVVINDGSITKNFTMEEILVHQTETIELTPKQWAKVQKHWDLIQQFREWYNKPITVTSGIRGPIYNKNCGGISSSNHLTGTACDLSIKCDDTEFVRLAKKWKSICNKAGVVGEAGHYGTFIHLGSQITYSTKFYNWKKVNGVQKNMYYKI